MLMGRFLMNEANAWGSTLAQEIALYCRANPKVRTVAALGSLARGDVDRYSDLDLGIFWSEPPTEKERRDIIMRSGGRRGPHFPARKEKGWWSDTYEVGGITLDIRHMLVETMEHLLTDVLEHADPALAKQQCIAALLTALPLFNSSELTRWQQRAAAYPGALGVAMVRAYITFRPAIEQEMLAQRHDLLVLYESFCTVQKHLLLVLMGLNHLYFPGFQWIERLMEQMQLAPPNLAVRCQQLFSIVGIDPLAGVYQLHDLVEETFVLIETHLPEIDTRQARERFRARRADWEHMSDGLLLGAQSKESDVL
jgi:hypothetical protein